MERRLALNPASRIMAGLLDSMKGTPAGETDFYALAIANLMKHYSDVEMAKRLAILIQRSLRPGTLAELAQAMRAIDLSAVLPGISVPTLVVNSDIYPFGALESSREVAAVIRGARLLDLNGADAVAAAIAGFVSEHSGAGLQTPENDDGLSAREREVLRLIAQGKTNPQIADALVISRSTVQNHVSSILTKAGLANRAEAVAYALRHGLT
jgi:DNA-binding CsgD family transcriptional regulator